MKRIFLAVLAVVAIFGISAWADGGFLGFRWWSWHQKLTIAVDTPEGVKTASSVVQASWEIAPEWFRIGDSGGGHGVGALTGEAVVLKLGDNRYLFVLLKGYSAETAIKVFAEPPLKTDNRREYVPALDRIATLSESRPLEPGQYPFLATFGDINDPASVKLVDPENLAATFGPGYALQSISMSITGELITDGKVQSVLKWVLDVGFKRFYLDPNTPALMKNLTQEQLIRPSDFLSSDHWRK